jgi:predicted MPP superfamily phosphohydrolase
MFRLILISIILADLLWWWRADHLARRAHKPWLRVTVAAFMLLQLIPVGWMFTARWLGTEYPSPPTSLMSAVYLWHLVMLPVLIATLIPWHITRGVRALFRRIRPKSEIPNPKSEISSSSPQDLSRRAFLATTAVLAPPIATIALSAYSRLNLRAFRIRELALTLPTLPRALHGLTIAHIADVHAGTFTSDRLLTQIVEATNRLAPDLILLPGDLINNRLADLPDALRAVRDMQPRHATVMCLGNHDLIENGPEFIRRAKAETTLLIDESTTFNIRGEQLQVLGLNWYRSDEQLTTGVAALAKQLNPAAFPILLAHHPHAFDEAARQGIPLTLSGHTHGGQLMANDNAGFGPLMYRYWSGLYQKPEHNDASLVVSNGVGHWFPLRLNAPAEIVHITLRSPQA